MSKNPSEEDLKPTIQVIGWRFLPRDEFMFKVRSTVLAVISAISFASLNLAQAQTQGEIQTNQTVCDAFRTLAGSIMQSRQNGESKASLLAVKSGNPDHDKLGAMLIEEAYSQPVLDSPELKSTAINTFADKWRNTCNHPVPS
ncbi:hypothetical protein HNR03_006065 [Pseudomonas sp. JAI111]|uniref:hypothetical protein n=1 Tax=Pseudomonas sp. JAI111 TaxID=2735913 RepID=UPI0021684C84|nr:hypothetical protein [Pseudomonas sp. JAI111]MCS3841429.1 hypothetical protein [Pseudomonas sp. JAI111]